MNRASRGKALIPDEMIVDCHGQFTAHLGP
jgi:hypothetical protein